MLFTLLFFSLNKQKLTKNKSFQKAAQTFSGLGSTVSSNEA